MCVSCTPWGNGQLLLVLALGAIFGMLRVGLDIQAVELKKKERILLHIRRTQASLVKGRSYIRTGLHLITVLLNLGLLRMKNQDSLIPKGSLTLLQK